MQAGFTFGGHTVTHPRLSELVDQQATDEIQLSKTMLEDQLGTEVNLFSYPYSDHNDRIRRIVAESGYIAACGGERGDWGLFNLWRAQCYRSDNMLSFVLKASGWYHRFIWLREQSPVGPSLRRVVRRLRRLLRDMKVKSPIDTS
jgi:peptidoglycan/xylan/chitin deacetylase (PgdA/CDA1 family)